MEIMAGLPGGAEVADVLQIERDEARIEVREIEVPDPAVARQREESVEVLRIEFIDRLGGWFGAARVRFLVVIAQDRHEGNAAEEFRRAVDQGAEDFDSLLSRLMKAGNIVARGENEVRIDRGGWRRRCP